jgi:hypothetical protein
MHGFFAGVEGFIRDLFLQSSPGTPLANFGPSLARFLIPFLIDFGPYFVSFRYILGSFQK